MKKGTQIRTWLSIVFASVIMLCGVPVHAAEVNEIPKESKIAVINLNAAFNNMAVKAVKPSRTMVLSKDYATSNGQTGNIFSSGQIVDFRNAVPRGSTIDSITIYTETSTKVTKSKYTTINNYIITNLDTETKATVQFMKTNNPSATSRTTAFEGESANTRFWVRLQGRIISQDTGMDGFTVFGGKMIIAYH